jgi:hypothetical protein
MTIKTIQKLILMALILMSPLVLSSCKEDLQMGQEVVIETSHKKPFKWVTSPPKHKRNAFYFVGEDTSYKNTDRYAYQVALSKASTYFNTRVKNTFSRSEQSTDDVESSVMREALIKNISEATLRGARHKETYWEKVEKLTDNGMKYFYRVYVLIELDKEAIKATEESTLNMQEARLQDDQQKLILQNIRDTLMKTYDEGEDDDA